MKRKKISYFIFTAVLFLSLFIITNYLFAGAAPPASPVKLIFIHHSTGGNWLADANENQPYGELGAALMQNNYYVSAANYGWGHEGIGDRTDIPNWAEWFAGENSSTIMQALFNENGQNFQEYGSWERLSADPGGENTIIMFKSCFPNSDLFGETYDVPADEVNDQYTVSNAKAVYNLILTTFAKHQDKLFVVITAPPQTLEGYGEDYQTPAHRAANARAFNNWLVNEWLKNYPYKNVAVFDYFNVLTGVNNHHRYNNGQIEHVADEQNNLSAYASDPWDAHPNTDGHKKATQEFVPLLNYYYNAWKSGSQDTNNKMPAADIKINGSDDYISVSKSSTDNISISIGMDAGTYSGVNSDWWIVHFAPDNSLYSFSLESMDFTLDFTLGLNPVIQMHLITFFPISLSSLTTSNLKSGNHIFCFGIDMTANNMIDSSNLCYDCVSVEITE